MIGRFNISDVLFKRNKNKTIKGQPKEGGFIQDNKTKAKFFREHGRFPSEEELVGFKRAHNL